MTADTNYSDEDLALLTEEERAALVEDDDDDGPTPDAGEQDGTEDGAKDGTASDPGDGAAEESAAAEDEPAAPAADQAAAAAAEKPAAPAADPGAQPASTPAAFPLFEPPADAQAKLEDLSRQQDELAQRFDEGEITATELHQQSRALAEQEREIRDGLLLARISSETQMRTWEAHVTGFLAAHNQYAPGSQMFHLLDAEVRRLQEQQPDAQHDPAILAQAHEGLQALFAAQPAQAAAAPAVPPRPALPPTLAHLPAADITGAEGEFAGLDRLSGEAYEEALASLTDAQRERYLAGR